MRRVLLTGASGFIGERCALALADRGFDVHAADLRPPQGSRSQVHRHKVDLFHGAQVRALLRDVQAGLLLHLAWTTRPGEFWTCRDNLRWVEASVHLLRTFCEYGGKRAVMAGSCAEYDWKHGCCREYVTPLAPATLYGRCKHALSLVFEAFSKQVGLSAAWARIFFLYGPCAPRKKFPGSVITALLSGQIARCTHGSQIRDFLHVSDVADALATVLASNLQGQINIASGQPTRLRDMVYLVADYLGRRDLIRLGALQTPKEDPPILIADVRRLRHELGWSPRYDLKHGLENTIHWCKSHQNGDASQPRSARVPSDGAQILFP